MGHYASEMDAFPARDSSAVTGYANKDAIEDFYEDYPGTGTPCPKCGADLTWHWMEASNLMKHIEFHNRLGF